MAEETETGDPELAWALAELDGALGGQPMDFGLRPGLSDAEIDEISAPLRPLLLPADLRQLYRWHDGTIENHSPTVVFDHPFLQLDLAMNSYAEWSDPGLGLDWNPAWFPAFGTQSGAVVVLDVVSRASTGPLWVR